MLFLFLQCTYSTRHYAQYAETAPIVISSVVGDSIDREERDTYHLFQSIEGFLGAQVYALPHGGYETRMVTTEGRFKAVMADPSGIRILKDYLEHYGTIENNRALFEKQWSIISYDDLGQPITRGEVEKVGNSAEAMCGVGGCCLGVGISGYIGYGKWQPEGDAYNVVTVCFVAPCGLTAAWAGGEIGKRFDRIKAIQAIKNARKPHPYRE